MKIRMIQDGKPNAMLYKSGRVSGPQMYGEYMKKMFELKKAGCVLAKQLISALWGAQGQIDKMTLRADRDDGLDIFDSRMIASLIPSSITLNYSPNNPFSIAGTEAIVVKKSQIFSTPFGRVKTFITAAGRRVMANTLLTHQSHVKRVQTDGFIMDIPLVLDKTDVISFGTEMGQLKVCRQGKHVKIEGVNKVHWDD
jgi:hypothetical protein